MVSRAAKKALVIADMPFLTFQINKEKTIENAGKLIQEGGANAVKIEGAGKNIDTVKELVDIGIPVQGHLGLTPQSVHKLGWKVQAKTTSAVQKLLDDAEKLQEAGIFSLVLEAIPIEAAKLVTETIEIPTIGIGAGKYCDGQVLVLHDLLGMGDYALKFVKVYSDLKERIQSAISQYSEEVKNGLFPDEDYSYKTKIVEN
jgi:3-methyl-2-oxobutanoate hydroxymethyltransferase